MRIGYVRVSTVEQNTDRQLVGVDMEKTFTDKASGRDAKRPQLELLLDFIREGDTLVVHSMDRLARNLLDMRKIVDTVTGKGAKVQFIREGLTFAGDDDSSSKLILNMMRTFAEFERCLARERQREGIEQAKLRGVYKGRKPALTDDQIKHRQARAAAGVPKTALAEEFGISRATVYNYLADKS